LRLLFLNRCYHPDVESTGQLLHELCSDLALCHDLHVVAGQPNLVHFGRQQRLIQQEEHDGVHVLRVRNVRFSKATMLGRAVGLASYLLLSLLAGLRFSKPDRIVVETDPPVLGALGALLKWWHRCPLIFYVQELHPEAALVLGRLRPGMLTRLLHCGTQVGLRHADRVVVIGEDMRRRVLARGITAEKVSIVPNWADTRALYPRTESRPLRQEWGVDDRFVVMYSGNLGLSQNLDQVLTAARELRQEPVAFVLVGDGAAKRSLQEQATAWSLDNVKFLPYQPKQQLCESLNAADLHLIPQARGMAGCFVPSKLYGILATGRPYLAAIDADSEVAAVTRDQQTGLLIEPDAVDRLVEALRWCLGHREELRAMGQRGRLVAQQLYDRKLAVARFERALEEAAAPMGGPAPQPAVQASTVS
jgi:colanic acid biosynthesis glycosyl transferase WcaI